MKQMSIEHYRAVRAHLVDCCKRHRKGNLSGCVISARNGLAGLRSIYYRKV